MTWSMLLKALPKLPSESAEDIPVYVILSKHGWTAHVSYWNGQALLQLCAQCQDRNGSQCSIMVTLDLSEALERDISRAETLLQEHNVRTHKGTARLLFHQLSTEDSRHYRHLEVSQWQGFVRASMQRFLINNQSQLCPTRDSVQYNAEQLKVLRRLLPQLCDDFQTAARSAQHMTEQEQDTMALILAREQKDMEDNNPIMMAWMRLIVMILAPVLLPQLAVAAGHCLDIKHLVYMPIGHVVLKIYVPCKNFHVPNYNLYKSCKAYVYYWKKNKYMPRMKSHLPCRASNHKSLCALRQIYIPWARGHAFMPSSLSECEVWGKTGPYSIHFHGRAARAISRYCGGHHTWTCSACTEVKAKECHVTTKWQET